MIFPSNEGKSEICDFLYQTCRILAKKNLVIVLNIQQAASIKEIFFQWYQRQSGYRLLAKKEGIYYFTPLLILPFRRFPTIIKLNICLNILALQLFLNFLCPPFQQKILWYFFPQLSWLHQYFGKGWDSVYDIIDFYTSPDPQLNHELLAQKKYLLQQVSVVTAISETLKNVYKSIFNRDIMVVPQGFNLELFERADKTRYQGPTLPQDKPIIGFIGHINERLDFKLLYQLIKKNAQWRFAFIGPKETNSNVSLKANYDQIDKIFRLPNVTWLDQQPKEFIPGIIKQFSIGMIPYDTKYEFNRYCYPMKLFEYFYEGKPVIATEIEELKKLKSELICVDGLHWEKSIIQLLREVESQQKKEKKKIISQKNSWENKIKSVVNQFSEQTPI